MKFADLHLHTTFSDSTYTPEKLIQESSRIGFTGISVVDHDNVDGLQTCISLGRQKNIEVIPGVELSCEFKEMEVHILGYFIDYKNKEFVSRLEFLRKNRAERVYKIAEKLKGLGICLAVEEVFNLALNSTVGRPHVARAMVAQGLVGSTREAFDRYLGDKAPAFVLNFRFNAQEAIKLIKDAGGVPILAHPYLLRDNNLIMDFIGFGIMGLEIYYPEHTSAMISKYLDIVNKNKLLVTGGSDFHGSVKPDVKLGDIRLPYKFVDKIREARR
ncbi:MAG: PHP domain-containing protein [Candidatus Omnitrophota bacterium]